MLAWDRCICSVVEAALYWWDRMTVVGIYWRQLQTIELNIDAITSTPHGGVCAFCMKENIVLSVRFD